MKKIPAVIIAAIALLAGAALGYFVTTRKVFLTREDYIRLSHVDTQHRAQVYYRFLQAQDSGHSEELAAFRNRALTALSDYVQEVEFLRETNGYPWIAHDAQFYHDAKEYLSKHPFQKSER